MNKIISMQNSPKLVIFCTVILAKAKLILCRCNRCNRCNNVDFIRGFSVTPFRVQGVTGVTKSLKHLFNLVKSNQLLPFDSFNCVDDWSAKQNNQAATPHCVVGLGRPFSLDAQPRPYAVFLCILHSYVRVLMGYVGTLQSVPVLGTGRPTLHSPSPQLDRLGDGFKPHYNESKNMTFQPNTQKPYLDTAPTFFEPHPQATAKDAFETAFQLLEQAESTADAAVEYQTYSKEVQGVFFALLTQVQLARKALNHMDKLNMEADIIQSQTPPPQPPCCCTQEDKFAKAIGFTVLESVKHLAQVPSTTSQ